MNVNDMSYTDLVKWVRNNPDAAASKLIVLDLRARSAETKIAAAKMESERQDNPEKWPAFFVQDN